MPTAVSESNTNPNSTTETTNNETGTPARTDRMWVALKAHVLRERARKRQQHEAEIEEERQRRERERQDVMTLGETREQVSALEARLAQLKEEKHQLFRQLKKVLHEDDNRRRQLVKENEMLSASMPQVIPSAGMHPQLFLTGAGPGGPQQQGVPGQGIPQGYKSNPSVGKRGRSPSPPQGPTGPPGLAYPQGATYAAYKPQQTAVPPQQYQPQKDDSRRELVRAVLWNKSSQYTTGNQPTTSFYVSERAPIVYYPTRGNEPTAPPRTSTLYDPSVPGFGLPSRQPPAHVNIHGGTIPITPAQPASKTGSITSGYPVRSQPLPQYQTQPPQGSLYSTPGAPPPRPMYAGAPMQGYATQPSRE